MYTLEIQNLTKKFGHKTVFRNISVEHKTGVLGISGSNGSGKSTLLKCISYLFSPSAGTVNWKNGEKILPRETVKKDLGYMAPYINLYPELTPLENLRFIKKLRKLDLNEQDLKHQLAYTGLKADMHNLPYGNLSSGQQQRTKLAIALLHDPRILLLDEPGTNLDSGGRKLIENTIDAYRSSGTLAVLASNNEEELNLCDQIISVEQN